MKHYLLSSLLGSLALSLSLPASASSVIGYGSGTKPEDMVPMSKFEFETEQRDLFTSADLNNNSQVSFEETQEMTLKQYRKMMKVNFDRLDKDFNGYLTETEMGHQYGASAQQPVNTIIADQNYDKMVDEALEKFDTDENGSVSRDEMINGMRAEVDKALTKSQTVNSNTNFENPYFTQQDKDKSGSISFEEYSGQFNQTAVTAAKFQRVYMRDKDLDGTITYSENEAFIADIFDGLDEDEDGVLSVIEQRNGAMYAIRNIHVGAQGVVTLYSYGGGVTNIEEITPIE